MMGWDVVQAVFVWFASRLLDRGDADYYIRDCRRTHALWIQAEDEGRLSEESLKIGGNKQHHKKWVARYNFVLSVLRRIP